MSSERTRIGIIFGAVALVAGGGAFYFFKIYQPRHVRGEAQDEIAAWETRWAAARTCLLGPTPASSRTSEALAIHELSPDPWDRGSCTPLVGRLSRGPGADTGLAAVEGAWSALEGVVSKTALAFADHVSKSTLRADRLPAALDELDAARAALRAAAELAVEAGGGQPLAAAQVIALADGTEPVLTLDVDREARSIPSAHGAVYFGHTATHAVQLSLVAGAAPSIGRVGPGTLRAAGDPAWGVTALAARSETADREVQLGALDLEGAMATPAIAKLDGKGKPALTDELQIAAAVGHLADGAIAFRTATKLAIARVKSGVPSAEPTLVVDEESAAGFADVDGRGLVAWRAGGKQLVQWLASGAPIQVGSTIDAACFAGDRAWLQAGRQLRSLREQTVGEPHDADLDLVGCTPDGAITRDDTGTTESYTLCTDACRRVTLPGAPRDAAVTSVAGKLVAIGVHGGVLGVWSEAGPPRYFALADHVYPLMIRGWPVLAMSDGKRLDVVMVGLEKAAIVRIPAR